MIPVSALGKQFKPGRSRTVQGNRESMFHGTDRRLHPNQSIHPRSNYAPHYEGPGRPFLAQSQKVGPKPRVYASPMHHVARVFSSVDYHSQSIRPGKTHYVYKVPNTGHEHWKPGAENGFLGLREAVVHHSVKPTHVRETHPHGLPPFGSGNYDNLGHGYSHRGRKLKSGFVSKLRHDNITPHTAVNSVRRQAVRTGPLKVKTPRINKTPRHSFHLTATHAKVGAGLAAGAAIVGAGIYAHHLASKRKAERARRSIH